MDNILRANEYTHEFSNGSVESYDSNQLASNNPIEDTRAEASCLITSGKLKLEITSNPNLSFLYCRPLSRSF